ncbi:MAG TPA: tRNA lysidine(34) synthetase TilS [Candidatus Saccharimonadales bacterium]|nr:tRNA lysidine(34) synthetase TilS [Candidatus Saccharimonadales bacterium]
MIPPQIRSTVLAYAHRHDLLRPGRVVVAVSGGTDSVALLVLLADCATELGLVLQVAHFDHRTRPKTAAADAAFVAGLAASVGAPFRMGRAEVPAASEEDARRARYAFLRRAAAESGARAIATAHTRDDQAETVLLHATRGSGLGGLAGMRPSRDGIIRPFLALSRADTVAICAAAGISPREDPSNRDLAFARNRVRRRVLPELERINPQARLALARLAEAAAEAADDGERDAARALAAALDGDVVLLDRLLDIAPEVRDAALARWWERSTGRALSTTNRLALGQLAGGTAGSAAADLPGGRALREYRRLTRVPTGPAAPARAAGPVPLQADVPVLWEGWTILLTSQPDPAMPGGVPAPASGELFVRGRRPGDRIGHDLRTKVQDLYTDAKVPARMRDSHPLITTGDEAVWWVVGLEHALPVTDTGRWIGAKPPEGVAWSFSDGARSIEGQDQHGKDERHELR